MEILNIENLSKSYGKKSVEILALDKINLTVKSGEFIAIIGASGSGKSTLLHLIGGVDKPSSGKIVVDGIDVYAQKEADLAKYRREKVGLIYQFYNLIPTLNIPENITLPALLDNKKINKEFLAEIIKKLELQDRLDHLPNELSGGQQQRVAIGRALFNQPSIILADEPTGNLDSKASLEIMQILKTINEEYHQTIIMVTHDLNLAQYAKRIIELKDGRIIKDYQNENHK